MFHVTRSEGDAGVWREAVRLALTSGRTRREVADDLGVGLSSLTRWIGTGGAEGSGEEADSDLHAELKRLRRENAVLKQERDILKKAAVGSTGQRNGSFKAIGRRLEAKRFPRPRVEAECDLIEVMLSVNG